MSETSRGRRWPLSRIVGVGVLALALFSAASVALGAVALAKVPADRGRTPLDAFSVLPVVS